MDKLPGRAWLCLGVPDFIWSEGDQVGVGIILLDREHPREGRCSPSPHCLSSSLFTHQEEMRPGHLEKVSFRPLAESWKKVIFSVEFCLLQLTIIIK